MIFDVRFLQQLIISCAAVLLIASCAALKPMPEAVYSEGHDSGAISKAGYLVRYLLPADERLQLENKARQSAPDMLPEYAGAGAHVAAQGLADTSLRGAMIGFGVASGVRLLQAMGPDGSSRYVSNMYLPESVNGVHLDTAEAAGAFARTHLLAALQGFAEKQHVELSCRLNCDGPLPHFVLYPVRDRNGNNKPFYIFFVFHDMQAAGQDAMRDAALGFHPAWEGDIRMFTSLNFSLDDKGKIKTGPTELGEAVSRFGTPALYSRFGHDLLRDLTAEGYFVYGVRMAYSRMAAVHGRLFNVFGTHAGDLIDYEMLASGG